MAENRPTQNRIFYNEAGKTPDLHRQSDTKSEKLNCREYNKLTRRGFIAGTTALLLSVPKVMMYAAERRPKVVLRSSWQMVNIGDIAHTAGVVALLDKYIPEADVTLWPSTRYSEEVQTMEQRRFPKLKIAKGRIAKDGSRIDTPELQSAVDGCDFILHGSGPSFVAAVDLEAAVKRTGKPFGICGITWTDTGSVPVKELMNQAKFIFFRDGVSLGEAKKAKISCPVMEFGPDGAFAFDIINQPKADAFLKAHQLEPGRFACVIPRLRVTPYWNIYQRKMTEKDRMNFELDKRFKEHDHKPLRDAVIEVVRKLGMKVLLCPEDMSQMAIGKELLYDRLPEEIKSQVVWRPDYWITDEALGTYRRSAGLFGLEMHSPILCVGNGIPAIVGRFQQQTSKGTMWNDIGLPEWLFDFDREEDIARYVPGVIKMLQNQEESREKVRRAREFVQKRQRAQMNAVRRCLGLDTV